MRIGSGVAATAVGGVALIGAEVLITMRRTYLMGDSAPPVTGEFGDAGDPLVRVVMLGDSTAAGVGVSRTQDTIGAQVSMRLSTFGYSVKLSGVAISGSRAGDLAPQVGRALVMTERPDVAIIIVGGNDATHLTPLDDVGRQLEEAVRRLREAGIASVERVDLCTACNPELFFSHRRDKGVTGRQGVIGGAVRRAAADQIAAHQTTMIGVKLETRSRVSPTTRSPTWTQQCARKGQVRTPKTQRAGTPARRR